ncbi:sugar transferase [Aerococcaceae bacterium DSM 111176]|nr:sugar transferase [Aerococcaceae bacterium DSM 111176]
MNKRTGWNNVLRFGAVVLGSIVSLISIYISFLLKFGGSIPSRNFYAFEESFIWITLGYIVIHMLFGTYIFYNKNLTDILYNTVLGQIVLSAYMMALTYAGSWLSFPRSVILINFFVGLIILFVFNILVFWVYQTTRGSKRVMVVGQDEAALEAVRNFTSMKNRRHEVTHVVLSNYYYNIKTHSDEVDIVYLTGRIEEPERLRIYEYLMSHNKKLFLSTNFENLMMVNPNIMNFEDESIIELSSFGIPDEQAFVKRLIDVIVSLFLVILTAPIMLVTVIAIRLDSPGPALYKQERVTYGNKPFNILKFRSMSQTAEAESGPVLAASNDSRVTRVGKFIRSTRIDELPQLLNVLMGDMSLVGPRPERPFFVEQFQAENPYYRLRHHVRAGITGYAQVYGKYTTNFNNKLNFDLLYIKQYSLAFDFKLLFQTVKILFDKVSARGLDEEVERGDDWSNYEEDLQIYH